MADQLTHPADRAVHAVNNAAQILSGLVDADLAQQPTWMVDVGDARRLLQDVAADIQALQDFSRAQSAELLELREQGLRDAQCINRLEALNTKLTEEVAITRRMVAEAQTTAEALVKELAPLAGLASDLFTRANGVRLSLSEWPPIPQSLTIHTTKPRLAAAER